MNEISKIMYILIFVSLLSVIAFYYGCKSVSNDTEPYYNVPTDKYLFIERKVHIDGETIEGEYSGPLVDFPTYDFDSARGILYGWMDFPITQNFIGLYGSGTYLSGAAGGGASSALHGIYYLPYQKYQLLLLSINPDESVLLNYKNSLLSISKGQEWRTITTRLDTQETGIASLITTERIINHGFQQKSKIYLIYEE